MAELMSQVIGHNTSQEYLLRSFQRQTLPHALAFAGPSGLGKFKFAIALAQVLICESLKSTSFHDILSSENKAFSDDKNNFKIKACGYCGACLRVEKLQSENLLILQPEKNQMIKLEQVKQVFSFLSLSSHHENRVIIIDQAQTLNPQAANALLKTLEEPTDAVYFILITPDVRLLVPTLRSRCQLVLFQSLTIEQLKKIVPGQPDWAYISARGQVSRLMELSGPHDQEDERLEHLILYERFWNDKNFLAQIDSFSFIKERSQAIQLFKNWMIFNRDLVFLKLNQIESVMNADQLVHFNKVAHMTIEKLLSFVDALIQAEKDAEKCDLKLLLESMWVNHVRE